MQVVVTFRRIEWAGERESGDEGGVCVVHADLTLGDRTYPDVVLEVKRTAGATVADALEVIVPAGTPGPVHYARLRDCVERYVRIVGKAAGIQHLASSSQPDDGFDVEIGQAAAAGRCLFESE